MKRVISIVLSLAAVTGICSVTLAAELLEVKPVISSSTVAVEITADIPMTYSYYKVPGQARAVVDIADADPEKVEPLIVVNKGVVSSISIDKAQIAGLIVSRVIFNLVSESDIAVAASPDQKLLTVTFSGSTAEKPAPATPKPAAAPVVEEQKTAVSDKNEKTADQKPAGPKTAIAVATTEESDPLGLDGAAADAKPKTTPAPVVPATIPAQIKAADSSTATTKRETVVSPPPAGLVTIKKIVAGDGFIDILISGTAYDFKEITLENPPRVAIDITGAKSTLTTKSIVLQKMGVNTVRIGTYPAYTRIVIDAAKESVPRHTISKTAAGLRISF